MSEMTEFLVSLGLVEKDSKSWTDAMAKVEKLAERVAETLAAAGMALASVIKRTSIELDTLNFTAMRVNSSVGNLRALSYAFAQTGAASGAAGSTIEAFAERMRTNPATERLVNLLGVATRRNGALRDYTDILLDVGDKLNEEPSYVVALYKAGQFGLTEPQYNQFRRQAAQMREMRDAYLEMAKKAGVDLSRAGASSTALMQAFRETGMKLGLMVQAIAIAAVPVVLPLMNSLNDWITANRDWIVEGVDQFIDIVSSLVEWLGQVLLALAPVASTMNDIIEAATGDNGLVVAIEAISAAWMASVALRMFGVGGRVRLGIAALAAAFVTGRYIAPELFGFGPSGVRSTGNEGAAPRSLWGRIVRGVKSALGISPAGKGGTAQSGPMLDRRSFDEELKNPEVRKRLLAVTEAEVGSQGEDAQKAFMETIFNRAKARGQSLWDTLHGSYFPATTHSKADALMGDKRLEEKYRSIYESVIGGSNITNGATGNASGDVGFGGGPETFRSGWERFGIEAPDLPWWKREKARQEQDERDRDRLIRATPWGSPIDALTTPPLTTSFGGDNFSVTTTRTTKITVHGDTDPHRTAQDVTSAQQRVNMDMITSTGRAFA